MSIKYADFLKRLKEERKRSNLSQAELSHKLKIEQSHYSKVERGVARLTFYEVQRLYEVDMDVEYIFTGNRCDKKNLELFDDMRYSELLLAINILYSWIEYKCKETKVNFYADIFHKTEYMKFIRFSYSGDKTAFFFLRKCLNKTQVQMAELLGVDVKKLRALENGGILPDSEIIWKLYADYYILPAVIVQSEKGLALEICSLLHLLGQEEIKGFLSEMYDIQNLLNQFWG